MRSTAAARAVGNLRKPDFPNSGGGGMDDRAAELLVIFLAVATPMLASRSLSLVPIRPVGGLRRGRLMTLALAGPVNLLVWTLLRGPLGGVASRQTIGIVAGLAVFVIMGFGFGFLRRNRDDTDEADAPKSER
jgi:hypothetical protein